MIPRIFRCFVVTLCLGLATAAIADNEVRAWTGKTPALAATALQGEEIDLKELRGKVVVLNFWATWCGPCLEELPSLQRLRDAMKERRVEVITVNYGEYRATVAPFVEKQGMSLPVLLDTEKTVAKQWKVNGLPATFLIDAKGRARYAVFGERDWSDADSVALIEKLLAEDSVARR